MVHLSHQKLDMSQHPVLQMGHLALLETLHQLLSHEGRSAYVHLRAVIQLIGQLGYVLIKVLVYPDESRIFFQE